MIFINVWESDNDCIDHVVAVFLYVYLTAGWRSKYDFAGYGAGVEFLT